MREINLKEDLEKIYPLIKQLRNNLSLEDFLEKFQLAKKTQHYKLFAYEDKGAFKAACGVMPFNVLYHNHCLYICDFVVDETLRGKGIGQAFLKKIQIWAKNQGYNAGTIKIHTFDCDVSLDLFKRFCKFFISVLEFKDYCFILNYNLFDPHIMQTIWNGRIVFIFCPHETSPSNSNLSISFYLLIIPYNSIRNTKILQTIPPQNRYNFKPSYLKKLFLLSSSSRIFCFITLVYQTASQEAL